MHAVRGTIGHDPEATAKAEGRVYAPTTKQESRERFFAQRAEAFKDAAARDTAGAIERNAERFVEQRDKLHQTARDSGSPDDAR